MYGKLFASLVIATLLTVGEQRQAAAAPVAFPSSYLFNLTVDLKGDKVGTDPRIYALRPYIDYPGGGIPDGSGSLDDLESLTDTITFGNALFPQTQPIQGLIVLGVIDGLVADGDSPTQHLVLLMNPNVNVEGIPFASVFPGLDDTTITEADLINDLIVDTGYEITGAFASDEAVNAVSTSAYFNFDQTFNVVAFSTGSIIGTGTVSITAIETPEPATLAVLGLGLAGFAALRRRRA